MDTVDYAARRPRTRPWPLIVIGVLLVLALAAWIAASPYLFPGQLRAAAQKGDRVKLEAMIDFPRVREGLKSDLKSLLTAEMDKSIAAENLDDNPFAAGFAQLAKGLVGAMTDSMVDQAVTPAGLEKYAKGQSTAVTVNGEVADPLGRLFPAKSGDERINTRAEYLSFNRFRYVLTNQGGDARFDIDLQRRGLTGWQVVRITPRLEPGALQGAADSGEAAPKAAPEAAAAQVFVRERQIDDGAGLDKLGDAVDLDTIVGLKLWIEPAEDDAVGYGTSTDDEDGRLTVWGEHYEINIPKGAWRWEHGAYVVDGFFIPKSGGMHQGIVSMGLEPVDEGRVRTSPNYRVVNEAP